MIHHLGGGLHHDATADFSHFGYIFIHLAAFFTRCKALHYYRKRTFATRHLFCIT